MTSVDSNNKEQVYKPNLSDRVISAGSRDGCKHLLSGSNGFDQESR